MKHVIVIPGVILTLFLLASGVDAAQQDAAADPSYKTITDISYYEKDSAPADEYKAQQCKLDLYVPMNQSGFATVVWFHGGGLTQGSRSIPQPLKNQNIAVAAPGYRLHPNVSCPAYIEDAAASIAWVFQHIGEYGGDPNLIFLSGHSAGGYLASITGLDKKWLAKHGIDANRIAGNIPFSGHMITHFTIRQERGIPGTQPVVDEFAPLFHVQPDAPPLILITGDRNLELLGRYEENAYMMRMMKVAGHQNTLLYEMQGFDHGAMAAPAFSLLLRHVKEITEAHKKPQEPLIQPLTSRDTNGLSPHMTPTGEGPICCAAPIRRQTRSTAADAAGVFSSRLAAYKPHPIKRTWSHTRPRETGEGGILLHKLR